MIQLTDTLALKADKRSFMLCTARKRKDRTDWEAEFYYSDPEPLFRKLALLAMAQGIEEGSWETVARRLVEIQAVIEGNLSRILSLLPRYAKGGAGGEANREKACPGMGSKPEALEQAHTRAVYQ